jgi:hypothetical protein
MSALQHFCHIAIQRGRRFGIHENFIRNYRQRGDFREFERIAETAGRRAAAFPNQ